jgi:hypothetical protein
MMLETRALIGAGWRRTGALLLAVAAVGLPVNDLAAYALLVVLAVVIFTGEVSARLPLWLAAVGIVAIAMIAQVWLAPPRIEEGHNVFLPGAQGDALRRGLPADVTARMAEEFDALYPPAVRCKPEVVGCWQHEGAPDSTYGFSADGIWHKHEASRSVTALDFSDPVWLRLGFINELSYNWLTTAPDVHRDDRDRRVFAGSQRWRIAMPWFEMIRLPSAYVGGELCWRGELLWEGAGGRFSRWPGEGCRTIEAADAGQRVFGLAIKPGTLAMRLTPPSTVRLLQVAQGAVTLLAAIALITILVRLKRGPAIFALVLILLSVGVIAADDASFLGGVRPFDGGDDGLFYDGAGRIILRELLAGNLYEALRGTESVYTFTPGLRYFRALEHIVFGETFLGYLSLVLLLPFLVYRLLIRFLSRDWSLVLIVLFIAVPIGLLFGTSFVQYQKWAARGFADPAAYICYLAGVLAVIDVRAIGPSRRLQSAFFGGLLLAFAVMLRPVVAPAAAVILAGAGLFALYRRDWPRVAGLCVGFLPVFCMPLHNWYFGDAFVMFTKAIDQPDLLVMPPSAYAALLRELITFDLSGGISHRAIGQLANWLSGPAESCWTIPLNAAGVAILIYVVARGRSFDPWLRLVGGAALAQHAVAFFYVGNVARYHLLTWLLTMVVVVAYGREIAIPWIARRYPGLSKRILAHPVAGRLASGLRRLQEVTA